MSLSMSDVALPAIQAGLSVLDALVKKAEVQCSEQGIKPAALLEARLAPDMFSFTDQIQAATDTVRRGLERICGLEISSKEDPAATFEALKARVAETLQAVRAMDAGKLDASIDHKFELAYSPELKVPYTGRTYLLSFLLPNFYFHVTTAYNILRERGLDVGKMDYLGPIGAAYQVL
jgi:hypothetical protein